jgi:hypothetical protein
MIQTAESIETESALVRSQLVTVAADIRHHADPTVIVDAAKASFKRRTDDVPTFLKQNANPLGMLVLGGAVGAVLTGFFAPSRRSASAPSKITERSSSAPDGLPPNVRSKANAALLSTVGVGLGYVAGMFVPTSTTEERFLEQPKEVLSQHLDEFLQKHTHGMKMTAANAFGLSRLSAVTLVGLAMFAEVVGKARPSAKSVSL